MRSREAGACARLSPSLGQQEGGVHQRRANPGLGWQGRGAFLGAVVRHFGPKSVLRGEPRDGREQLLVVRAAVETQKLDGLAIAHWSSFVVPADVGRAPASLARAEGHDETSASRRSVEVPRVATGSRAIRAPSVSDHHGTSPPATVNIGRTEEWWCRRVISLGSTGPARSTRCAWSTVAGGSSRAAVTVTRSVGSRRCARG